MKNLRQIILSKLQESPNSELTTQELRKLCGTPSHAMFRTIMHDLIDNEEVVKLKSNRFSLNKQPPVGKTITGILHLNSRGFGFVTPDHTTGEDVFIPVSKINQAMNGDLVEVRLEKAFKASTSSFSHKKKKGKEPAPLGNEKGAAGEIIKILKFGFENIIGRLVCERNQFLLIPLRRELPETISVIVTGEITLSHFVNHWVECSLLRPQGKTKRLECQFLRDISAEDSILGDLHAVIAEFNLPPPYSEEVLEMAKQLEPFDVPNRVDDRHLFPITIDPKDAKDFDDAISLSEGETPETVTIGIHIADVAAYIQPHSFLDTEASERCFTAYLPGMTLPMLPHPLAAVQCSLVAQEERFAHSVFLQVNPKTGEVRDYRRCRDLIKVWHRLNHEETDFFLETGTIPTSWPEGLHNIIFKLNQIARNMRRFRQKQEQFLELEIPETRIITTGMPPEIVGLKVARSSVASELVEEYMLAANSEVGKELIKRDIPAVFRVHEGPTEEGLALFCKNARDTYRIEVPNLVSRTDINHFMKSIKENELFELLSSTLLGSLSRAKYAAQPALHYGLGKHTYCHFTSPIRRYSDTLVHQQLLAKDCNLPLRSQETMVEMANRITAKEKNNDTAYYTAVDRVKLRYLATLSQNKKTAVREGIIAKIIGNNLLVYLPDLSIYGTLPLHLLTDDFYVVKDNEIIGKRKKKRFRCGDIVHVTIENTDFVRGQLTLNLEGKK